MGRRGRRQVLQLGDNSDSFLAKYGYNRQEEEYMGTENEESDEESNEDGRQIGQPDLTKEKENGDLIDDKVANFLAELENDDSNDKSLMEQHIGFQLNSDQSSEPEPKYVSTKSRAMYKNMFVKGDSEFTGRQDKEKNTSKKEEEIEWPEEPSTVWQLTLDDNTKCYYYWNTVTNEVTWEIPPDYTQYLLLMKSYEEKVNKLQKEGRVKPVKKVKEPLPVSGLEPSLPEGKPPASSKVDIVTSKSETKDKKSETKPAIAPSSSKTTLSALAAYADSDDESSESEQSPVKAKKDSDEDVMDLDDIDKILDSALDKKKDSEKKDSSKSESKSKLPKKLTLIDSIKEQVKLKAETEARRKAAIEEMMARELERRVGPPRKRSTEEETVWDSKRPKIVDYGHSASRSPVDTGRLDDRDSRSRRHDRDRDREDRHSHKEKKKKKDKDKEDHRHRDDRRRDHDKDHKKKDKKKDKDDKKKEKDDRKDKEEKRDKDKEKEKEKKKDKPEERDRKSTDSVKSDKDKPVDTKNEKEKIEEKSEIEQNTKAIKVEVSEIKQEPPEKKTLDVDIEAELENIVSGTVKVDVDLANKKMQASELADLALSKLEFLEVTKKGLSKLQILLVELETRHQDWQAGGLNTEYYLIKLEEANWQLVQYEKSAAPPGWSCHWDRSYRRYFYMNKRSKQTQWDYPDEEEEEEDRESSPEQGPVNKEPVIPPSKSESEVVTSTTQEESAKDVVSSTKDSVSEEHQTASWPDYESVTNYISGTEYSGVIRGEPPPPGTDLELLLTAPPPPPPPEQAANFDVQGLPEGFPEVGSSNDDDIDGEAMDDESTYQEPEISGSYSDTKTEESSVIARAPQMFSDNQLSSLYEPENNIDGVPFPEDSGSDAMETVAMGDASSAPLSEKKKKKKDKQSSGQLKHKNVSNLVQKWQKVKQEVAIEEQQREERQQAIRQKLDEWKKEQS